MIRVPLTFLDDLDTLISSYKEQSEATTDNNPRYDKLRQFLSELESILPE